MKLDIAKLIMNEMQNITVLKSKSNQVSNRCSEIVEDFCFLWMIFC